MGFELRRLSLQSPNKLSSYKKTFEKGTLSTMLGVAAMAGA